MSPGAGTPSVLGNGPSGPAYSAGTRLAPHRKENVMPHVTIVDSPASSLAQYEKVLAEIGHEPEGLAARYIGIDTDHVRIVAVWDTPEHAQQFFARDLGPALARALGPEPTGAPRVQHLNVERCYVR